MTGLLSFVTPPDFEDPDDADTDNIYEVEISASDGRQSRSETVRITVRDESLLAIRVGFPTPKGNLGGVTESIVTGLLVDEEDGMLSVADVGVVEVNGQRYSTKHVNRSGTASQTLGMGSLVSPPGIQPRMPFGADSPKGPQKG